MAGIILKPEWHEDFPDTPNILDNYPDEDEDYGSIDDFRRDHLLPV